MGITEFHADFLPLFNSTNGDQHHLGITNNEGTVIGTYVHGILDNEELRNSFLAHVRTQRNLPSAREIFNYQDFRKQHLNQLAKLINDSIDMEKIKEIVNGTW